MTTITATPARQTIHFGPGSLESLRMTTWTRKGTGWVRIRGLFFVYCGYGQTHLVSCDYRVAADEVSGTAEDVAAEMVNHWLDFTYQGCACDDAQAW